MEARLKLRERTDDRPAPWCWPREGDYPRDPAEYMRGVVQRLRGALVAGIAEGVDQGDVLLPEYIDQQRLAAGARNGVAVVRLVWRGTEQARFVAPLDRGMSGHHVHGEGSGMFMGIDSFNTALWRVEDLLISDQNLDGRPGGYHEIRYDVRLLDAVRLQHHVLADLVSSAHLLSSSDEQVDRLFSVEQVWEAYEKVMEPVLNF